MKIVETSRRPALIVLLFLALSFSSDAAPASQEEPQPLAGLTGSAIDSGTGQSVRDASVILRRGRIAQRPNAGQGLPADVLTDPEGRFRFDSAEPGEYTLIVAKRGYLGSPLHVLELKAGKIARREVRLDPLAKVSGRVVDDAGRGIKGARVAALLGSMRPSVALTRLLNEHGVAGLMTTSDSRGGFELFLPADQHRVTILTEGLGYAPSRVILTALRLGVNSKGIVIRLLAGLTARGRVLASEGAPLSGATVEAVRLEPEVSGLGIQEINPWATSGKDGTFVLKGLVEGSYTLRISHPTHASQTLPRVEIDAEMQELPEIFLVSQAKVGGIVTDVAGYPIGGARVLARAVRERINAETVSNADGSFFFTQFSPGASVFLWAEAEGYVSTSQVVGAPENGTVLVLRRKGTLRGRIEDTGSGDPLREFRVWVVRGSEEKTFHSYDGNFEWQGLPPGRWTVAAQAPGYQKTEVREVEIRSAEPTEEVVFRLKKGLDLFGRVLDGYTGEALSDVRVAYGLANEVGEPTFLRFNRTTQITDADGNFKFEGVPPGKVTIIAQSPLYAHTQTTVTAVEGTFVEVRLSKGGALSGHVFETDSLTPAPSARVSLFSETDSVGTTMAADPAGFFAFDHLSAGLYRLTAEASFGRTSGQDIALKENQRIDGLVLRVRPGATVHGTVRGTLPTEQKIVDVVASGPGGFTAFASTDFEGTYTIHGVPAGVIQLMASTSSFRSMAGSIEVPQGLQEITFDFDFPQTARLHGRVIQAGKPIPFADVSVAPLGPQMVRGSARTDEEGVYDILGLSDGNYVVIVGGGGVRRPVRISGDTILDIELPAP